MPDLVFRAFTSNPKELLIDSNSSINIDTMNFLSIDCSIAIGSLFIKIKNKTFSKNLQSDKSNNDLLMMRILDFFEENNLEFDDISVIFVNQGPGNFSGLRGSLATAKGISLSKNLELFGYDKFIWACAKFFNKENSIYSLIKVKEKYYIKKFNEKLISDSKVEEVTEQEIIEKYNKKFKVIEKSSTRHFDDKILKLDNLKTVDLKHNELEFLKLKGLLEKDLIKPIYLG